MVFAQRLKETNINYYIELSLKCKEMLIFSDWKSYNFGFDISPYPFTSFSLIEDPHFRSKVDYLSRTPFDRTLYLDTDTVIFNRIVEIFGILDRFDVGLTHAHHRNSKDRLMHWETEIPNAFPEFNSGVVLYRKTDSVISFFESWSSSYKKAGFRHDQTTLRELLWLSDLRIATLPPEYNLRFLKYYFLWSKSEAVPKIFHLKQLHMVWKHWFYKKIINQIRH